MVDVKLYHGDCLEVLSALPSQAAVITDIPYNQVNRLSAGLREFDKGEADDAPIDISQVVSLLVRLATGSIYVWCATEQCSELRAGFVEAGLSTRHCFWEKTNPAPTNGQWLWLSSIENCIFARKSHATFNRFCASPVWKGPTEKAKGFPCPKPVWLMKELIEASTNPGDTVIDPYMGSGSTGVACVQTGRNFVGVDIKKEHFDIAKARIEAAHGAIMRGG